MVDCCGYLQHTNKILYLKIICVLSLVLNGPYFLECSQLIWKIAKMLMRTIYQQAQLFPGFGTICIFYPFWKT